VDGIFKPERWAGIRTTREFPDFTIEILCETPEAELLGSEDR